MLSRKSFNEISPVYVTRRQVVTALSLTLTTPLVAFLSGCGSGGGGKGGGTNNNSGFTPLVTSTVAGRSELPVGVALSDMRAEAGLSSGSVAADGGFQVRSASGAAPALASIRHAPSDRVVLMGFIGRTSPLGAPEIGARGTALALLYFALDAPSFPIDQRGTLLDLLDQEPAITAFAETITRRIAANPFALDDGDAEIGAALKTAFDAVWGTPSRSRATSGKTTRADDAADFALLLVEPSGQQSGIEVVQGHAERTVLATNHKRRPAQVLTYRVGTEDTNKVRTDLPKALRLGDTVDLASTTSLSIFSTLANLRSGNTAFVPISTPEIALTAVPNAAKTFCETIVLNASGNPGEPAFFSEAHYADEVEGWRATLTQLNLKVFLDLFLGIIGTVLGGAAISVSSSRIAAFERAVAAVGEQSVTDLLARARGGELVGTITGFLEIAAKSDSLGRKLRSELVQIVLPEVEAAASAELAALLRPTVFIRARVLAAANLIIGAGDIGAVIADQIGANKAERWTETLLKPSLELTPKTATIGRGGKAHFSATVPGATGQELLYIWDIISSTATLTDNVGKTGTQIDTKSGEVDLVTTNDTRGTITVTVTAYVIGTNGNSKVGTATGTVTIDDKKQVVYGRYFTEAFVDHDSAGNPVGLITAYVVTPRVKDAKSYAIRCYGFTDKYYYGASLSLSYTEPVNLPDKATTHYASAATADEIYSSIAGVSSNDPGPEVAYLDSRFAGMTVEVTVSF